jgi:hypothetical protein
MFKLKTRHSLTFDRLVRALEARWSGREDRPLFTRTMLEPDEVRRVLWSRGWDVYLERVGLAYKATYRKMTPGEYTSTPGVYRVVRHN